MSEDKEEKSAWEKAWDKLETDHLTKGEDTVSYDADAAKLAERVYKVSAYEMLKEGEGEGEGDLLESWVLENFTLMRLYNEILDTFEDIRGEENWEDQVSLLIADDVVLFFTLGDEVISGLSGEILNQEMVSDSLQSDAIREAMTEIEHSAQMDLLFHSGIIDDGLKGELTNVHRTRNKLIHDLRQRHFLEELNNIESRLDRALDAINSLHEIAQGTKAFGEEGE